MDPPPPPPAYPFPIPPEEEEEVVLSSLQRLSIDQEQKQYGLSGASNSMLRFPNSISQGFPNGSTMASDHMNGLGSSSLGASSSHNYPSFPNGSTMSSNLMNGLGSLLGAGSSANYQSFPNGSTMPSNNMNCMGSLFGAGSSANYQSFLNGSTMPSNHMNGLGSLFGAGSSRNYPRFEHSTVIPNMGTQGSLENYYVNSYHPQYFQNSDVREPFFSLRMQGWTDYDICKIVYDDPTLLDEVNSDDIIIRLGGHKLGCKYLLKFLSNEGENPRLIRLIGSIDSFEALVYVVANQVNTRLGSRAMQSLIELLKERPVLIEYVLLVLKPNLLSVMLNKNGSHVIQKTMQLCKYGYSRPLEHIYQIAVKGFLELATTEHGVFSLKAVIETIEGPLKIQLLSTICKAAMFLSGHPYGNFVVQHVLEWHPNTLNLIFDVLITRGNLFMLSKDKYGSRVVEKCICSNANDVVVLQLLSDSKQLVELAQDKFGNYVVQKALEETMGKPALQRLVDILWKRSGELETQPCGRNVYNLVKKMLPNLTRN